MDGGSVEMIEFEYDSRCLVKRGEVLSGDSVMIRTGPNGLVAALSDGMGSGESAGIRSGMLTAMSVQLWERSAGCEKAFLSAMEQIPFDPVRSMDCASLSLLTVSAEGELRLCERGNPGALFFRRNERKELPCTKRFAGEREYLCAARTVRPGDTIILLSDGLERAGVGGKMKLGMGRAGILAFLKSAAVNRLSAAQISAMLENLAVSLFEGKLPDDVSFACIKVR